MNMSLLSRLACCGSVLNVIILGIVCLWPNICDDSECLGGTAAQRGGHNAACYDIERRQPTPEEDEIGERRYNCPIPKFSRVPMVSTALVSWPGSGSTWVRYLVQKATGIYTGSVYYDADLMDAGFLGENVTDSRVIIIKTHRERELRKYDRAILLIRDPYDAIVSEYNWRVCCNHLGRTHRHVYNTSAWHKFVWKTGRHWYSFHSRWLTRFNRPLHVVFYDELKQNLAMTLRNLFAFIDMPDTRVYCALRVPNGNFRRKPTTIASRDLFTYAQRYMIDNYQISVYEFIEQQQKRMRKHMLQIHKLKHGI